MRVLGIETATSIASVGIVVDGPGRQLNAHCRCRQPRAHAAAADRRDARRPPAARLRDLDADRGVDRSGFVHRPARRSRAWPRDWRWRPAARWSACRRSRRYARAAGPRAGTGLSGARRAQGRGVRRGLSLASDGAPRRVRRSRRPPIAPAAVRRRRAEPPCTLIGDGVDAYAELLARALGERAELIPFAALPPSGARRGARSAGARVRRRGVDDVAAWSRRTAGASEAELATATQRRCNTASVRLWKN